MQLPLFDLTERAVNAAVASAFLGGEPLHLDEQLVVREPGERVLRRHAPVYLDRFLFDRFRFAAGCHGFIFKASSDGLLSAPEATPPGRLASRLGLRDSRRATRLRVDAEQCRACLARALSTQNTSVRNSQSFQMDIRREDITQLVNAFLDDAADAPGQRGCDPAPR